MLAVGVGFLSLFIFSFSLFPVVRTTSLGEAQPVSQRMARGIEDSSDSGDSVGGDGVLREGGR